MEIVTELANSQLYIYVPVALAIFGAILVFSFGFKSTEQPPFANLSQEDRKGVAKKRKIKEKKSSVNGQIPSSESKSDKSPAKEKSPVKESKKVSPKDSPVVKNEKKESKQLEKPKKKVVTVEEIKNKKNRKILNEKPVDFDDGDWEKVPTKADKKKKSEMSPAKNDKKAKKTEIEKLVKDAVNKELKKKDLKIEIKSDIILELTKQVEEKVAEVAVVEEKKEKETKKKEKKIKEEPIAAVEEKKDTKKEKKTQKIEKETVEIPKESSKPEKKPEETPAGPVFDELGDTWTEAKAVKKSKKKARRDN